MKKLLCCLFGHKFIFLDRSWSKRICSRCRKIENNYTEDYPIDEERTD